MKFRRNKSLKIFRVRGFLVSRQKITGSDRRNTDGGWRIFVAQGCLGCGILIGREQGEERRAYNNGEKASGIHGWFRWFEVWEGKKGRAVSRTGGKAVSIECCTFLGFFFWTSSFITKLRALATWPKIIFPKEEVFYFGPILKQFSYFYLHRDVGLNKQ